MRKVHRYTFKNPRFVKTAIHPKDFPQLKSPQGSLLKEIAVAGRSNVGKSSLLNHLFQRKHLVKTSAVPGKTQALNFFALNDDLSFVDLPGYGFAQVPPEVRKKWGPMVQQYFEKREQLSLMLFLIDIRRIPNHDDLLLVQWAIHMALPFIVVLTKADKVTRNELNLNTKKILEVLGAHPECCVPYSVTKNQGRKELIAKIQEFLGE